MFASDSRCVLQLLSRVVREYQGAHIPFVVMLVLVMEQKREFTDKLQVVARAGRGGRGCSSFKKWGDGKRAPDGAQGGRGGSIWLEVTNQLHQLDHLPGKIQGPSSFLLFFPLAPFRSIPGDSLFSFPPSLHPPPGASWV